MVNGPQWLDCGNGELHRRRWARSRLQVRNGTAVNIDLERLPPYLLCSPKMKVNEPSPLVWAPAISDEALALTWSSVRIARVSLGWRPRARSRPVLQPNRDLGVRLPALGTDQSVQIPSEGVSHLNSSPHSGRCDQMYDAPNSIPQEMQRTRTSLFDVLAPN